MAKLPNAESAYVDLHKITGYLLSKTHQRGRTKAAFFLRFGFSSAEPGLLAEALLAHARNHEIAGSMETAYGIHYIIEGPIEAPDQRNPNVRAIWVVKTGETLPRLVTATPIRKGRK